MSPQCEAILNHLRLGRGLTTLEAMHPPFNCCRLSERIREIESAGHRILHNPIKVGTKRVMCYRLVNQQLDLAV